ncbi:hypothetical protein I4F81_008224 [Pyropia yezoensis]|uniref:Uncharacterized protein n=1 Tax=Pyropia yezoensis TaxID=2788 RepID=A0ACC3C7G2_PYRYE|nr:hypothetical protein I4F81_008224 [Neopyropia yezoensis]
MAGAIELDVLLRVTAVGALRTVVASRDGGDWALEVPGRGGGAVTAAALAAGSCPSRDSGSDAAGVHVADADGRLSAAAAAVVPPPVTAGVATAAAVGSGAALSRLPAAGASLSQPGADAPSLFRRWVATSPGSGLARNARAPPLALRAAPMGVDPSIPVDGAATGGESRRVAASGRPSTGWPERVEGGGAPRRLPRPGCRAPPRNHPRGVHAAAAPRGAHVLTRPLAAVWPRGCATRVSRGRAATVDARAPVLARRQSGGGGRAARRGTAAATPAVGGLAARARGVP